jgi:hypothetical protein
MSTRGGGGTGARSVWRIPVLLGLLTALGLLAALFGDGLWDAASALALASPLAVAAWHILRSSRHT